MSQALPSSLIQALQQQFQQRFTLGESARLQHGRDESVHAPQPPDGVVMAESTEEVAAVIRLCAEQGVPVIPYGVGSSVEGHVLAPRGGISLDLSGMNQVLAIHADDGDAVVQAGVTRKQLNDALKGTGLFFPIDPGADATLGGMAATRASGTNAVRYGTMKDNVLATTTVLADGRVMKTGGRARKSSAGYDLTRLLVGSEGTLGIMTELTVKLYPIPEAISAAVCTFPSIEAAVQTVIQTIQLGVPVARIELLDTLTVQAVNRYSKTSLREAPMLFFEFHGSPTGVEEQAQTVQEIARDNGGEGFEWATRQEDRNRLWHARHQVLHASINLVPDCKAISTDVCVPISRLAEAITGTQDDIAASGLIAPIVGHVGDGNCHVVILTHPDQPEQVEAAEALGRRIVERALALDGTCSGEHGIGIGKQDFLLAEHGDAVAVMASLKATLDPLNLLNPGKVLPPGVVQAA